MRKKINVYQVFQFSILFIIFNLFFFNMHFLKIITGTFSLEGLISPWNISQYFFTYSDEFVKRGFIGTIFDYAGLDVNYLSIFTFSIISANLFFVLFYLFAKKSFQTVPNKYFLFFMSLFVISPAVSMHIGYDIGRYDSINMTLMVLIIMLIIQPFRYLNTILVIFLICIGLLIHEAFVFINIPLLMAITYNEIKKDNHKIIYFYAEIFTIAVAFLILFLYGKADFLTLDKVKDLSTLLAPSFDHSSPLKVWTASLDDNVRRTFLSYYHIDTWLSIAFVLPLLFLYYYFSEKILHFSKMKYSQKLVFLSPLGLFPLFFIGIDFIRWVALVISLVFVMFAYLYRYREEYISINTFQISKNEKIIAILIIAYTLLGPLGVTNSFPYLINGLKKFSIFL